MTSCVKHDSSANEDLEKIEQLRYQAVILENVSDIIISCSNDNTVKSWNKPAEAFYNIKANDAIGKKISELVQIDYSPGSREEAHSILYATGSWKGEVKYETAKGETRYVFNTLSLVTNSDGEKIGVMVVGKDITEEKKAEEKIRESELFYRNLISDSLDGVLLVDESGLIHFSSPSVKNILGFESDELDRKNAFDFVHPDDFIIAFESFQREVEERPEFKFINIRLLKKDGEWLDCMVRGHNLLNNPIIGRIAIYFSDDSLRKKLEQQLIELEVNKQRTITKATIDGQEQERKEIGKELHDNIGQHLTTTQLFLDIARETANDSTLELILLASKSISDIINEVRRLSRSLTPPTLGDLGLIESIKDFRDSLTNTQVFNIRFYHSGFNEEPLSESMKLMLFRIIQQQINNVIRHADANNVLVKLEQTEELVTLVIADNGKGFDPTNIKNKNGLGFKNMINRAALFIGQVEIKSAPGKGCSLTVTVPIVKE